MENQQQQPQTTSVCRGGCGFYGSPATEGLCSKCFKDSIKRKQDTTRISPSSSNVASDASTSGNPAAVVNMIAANLREESGSSQSRSVEQMDSSPSLASETPVSDVSTAVETGTALLKSIAHIESTASLSSSSSANSLEDQTGESSPSSATPTVKKSNRCGTCKKRVGLTGFMCRCGGLYCGEHRYDQAHNCTFDYKTMEREELRKNNPVVMSDKIRRI